MNHNLSKQNSKIAGTEPVEIPLNGKLRHLCSRTSSTFTLYCIKLAKTELH